MLTARIRVTLPPQLDVNEVPVIQDPHSSESDRNCGEEDYDVNKVCTSTSTTQSPYGLKHISQLQWPLGVLSNTRLNSALSFCLVSSKFLSHRTTTSFPFNVNDAEYVSYGQRWKPHQILKVYHVQGCSYWPSFVSGSARCRRLPWRQRRDGE